jgi:3-hydroxyacyl-CoA dehydrogenase
MVVLGANGAMGSGSAAAFASAGLPTTLLARTLEKAEAGPTRAEQLGKGKIAPNTIAIGTYDDDLRQAVADADLIIAAARMGRPLYDVATVDSSSRRSIVAG